MTYEHRIVQLMIDHNVTFRDAIEIDFKNNNLDLESVFDLVDHLEANLKNLSVVDMFMRIYDGRTPDMHLIKKPADFTEVKVNAHKKID